MAADLMTAGAQWLDQMIRKAGAVREIILADSATDPAVLLTINASPGRSEWDEQLADGSVVRIAARDWILTASDLITDNGFEAPHAGWLITDSLDGSVYEVIAQGDSAWDWADTGHVRLRVHSQSLDRRN